MDLNICCFVTTACMPLHTPTLGQDVCDRFPA